MKQDGACAGVPSEMHCCLPCDVSLCDFAHTAEKDAALSSGM